MSELAHMNNFRFIRADISDPNLNDQLGHTEYRDIYDLACPTGVPNIKTLGEEMLLACSLGTLNLLRLAARCKARFLYASTAEVYGDPEVFPQAEVYSGNVDPVGDRSPYEEGKRFGEALTVYFARKYDVDARIVRIFNTYGPNMSPEDTRVIPQMLNNAIDGRPSTIYGDGQQTRAFLHVDDLIAGFFTVMAEGRDGEVYNIGAGEECTVLDLFNRIKALTGSAAEPVFRDHFINDHSRRRPDVSKLEALGWRQQIPMDVGLAMSLGDIMRNRIWKRHALQPPTEPIRLAAHRGRRTDPTSPVSAATS